MLFTAPTTHHILWQVHNNFRQTETPLTTVTSDGDPLVKYCIAQLRRTVEVIRPLQAPLCFCCDDTTGGLMSNIISFSF